MKKALLLTLFFALIVTFGFSQTGKYWSANSDSRSSIITDKSVARLSFPKEFKLFNLNTESLRKDLFSIVGSSAKRQTVISLPNADGGFEEFEVNEASNFEPSLQARFPEIRAYSGRGITDRAATLKLSISPQGIQTMVFRAGKPNEFIEAYSKDHSVYAVFKSQRDKGQLQWTCSTPEENLAKSLNAKVATSGLTGSSTGELKTMRLAQSCNGEYANYFGATSAAQVALVLAAYNATLTRCNGTYEKDLAIHLNLVPESVNVIYYDPATDPYTTLGAWNTQLQIALNTTLTGPATPIAVNNAAYDIGHMFGASGGGGNAGCIGCVCVDGIPAGTGATKGRGITSPADGIPMGDNFDIDYVAHEIGHQMGANHTFSMSNENLGQNKEVGSGITIMGYAGITSQDVAPHSIDIWHETSIGQIQANMAGKTCPITTVITANNATPVVAPVSNATIPISTPFALIGTATDANPGDVLTYCWEQDNDGTGQTGNNSRAYIAKPTGPNWLTFPATTSGTRFMPRLSTILAGLNVTPVLPGGDAIADIEALSSVARTLNFRLTVRDNSSYVADPPASRKVGQTAFTDMTVTVSATSGPFAVTQPNTNLSWAGGTTQTVTWDVNNTTAAPVSCANVRILLSTDGGNTFPTVLAASTPNDGTESVAIPAGPTTTARIKVEAVGNIFFDISNTNFNITGAPTAPTVTINQAAAQADPTSTSPINFTVVFNEAVTGFATGDVTLSGTAGATTAVVTGGPSTYNVAVSGMGSSGTVIATIPAGVCTSVASALANAASTSTDNTVTFNLVVAAPTVTINQAAAQPDPTSASTINFTVVFDQNVTGFATGDVTLSGTAGATTGTVTGTGTTYNVAVTGMTGSGTVIATVPAGVAQNATAQGNLASTSTDNTVTYNAPPGCTSVDPVPNQTVCNNSPTTAVNFTSS
ncbi:MAG: reprolysin-like metallopeptidase, partial [Ferruginibacter sp.]